MKFFLILEIKSVSDQGEKCIEPNIMDFFYLHVLNKFKITIWHDR